MRRVGVECCHGQTALRRVPGALYHVMLRGSEQRRIVRDDADRRSCVGPWIVFPRNSNDAYSLFGLTPDTLLDRVCYRRQLVLTNEADSFQKFQKRVSDVPVLKLDVLNVG